MKLIDQIEKNPELGDFLMLKIVDGAVEVDMEKRPFEMMSTMGCRTYNGFDITSIESYEKNVRAVIEGKPLYDDVQSGVAKDGRGNLCPVTVVLPTLAMQAYEKAAKQRFGKDVLNIKDFLNAIVEKPFNGQKDVDEWKHDVVEAFMKLLDKKINEAKDMLLERFDWICSQPAKSANFMYENKTMHGYVEQEGVKSALRHGTLVIGQLGLAEALQVLLGCDHTSDEGMELAKRIEQLYKDKCAKFKKELKLNFGVYFTPAESLCYTAMNKFKEKYGEIKNVSDHMFFTNSMHVPVWKQITPFKKIDIESKLTGYSSGGCISYIELDSSAKNNVDAMEDLVNYAMDHDIPYFAGNLKLDLCVQCGHQDEIGECCPECGSTDIQRLRRATGYLTGSYTTAFNPGKQSEVEHRVEHTAIEI